MLKNHGFHLFTKNVHLKRLKSFCIELIAIRKAFFKDKKLDWNVIERISHVLWWYISFLFIQLLKTHNKSWMILASNTWSLYIFFIVNIVHWLKEFNTLKLYQFTGALTSRTLLSVINELTGYLHLSDMYSWFSFRCPTSGVWKN